MKKMSLSAWLEATVKYLKDRGKNDDPIIRFWLESFPSIVTERDRSVNKEILHDIREILKRGRNPRRISLQELESVSLRLKNKTGKNKDTPEKPRPKPTPIKNRRTMKMKRGNMGSRNKNRIQVKNKFLQKYLGALDDLNKGSTPTTAKNKPKENYKKLRRPPKPSPRSLRNKKVAQNPRISVQPATPVGKDCEEENQKVLMEKIESFGISIPEPNLKKGALKNSGDQPRSIFTGRTKDRLTPREKDKNERMMKEIHRRSNKRKRAKFDEEVEKEGIQALLFNELTQLKKFVKEGKTEREKILKSVSELKKEVMRLKSGGGGGGSVVVVRNNEDEMFDDINSPKPGTLMHQKQKKFLATAIHEGITSQRRKVETLKDLVQKYSSYLLNRSDFDRVKGNHPEVGVIGSGSFGVVYRMVRKRDGLRVAVKKPIRKNNKRIVSDNDVNLKALITEFCNMARVNEHLEGSKWNKGNNLVIKLHGFFLDHENVEKANELHIVMEEMHGSLESLITNTISPINKINMMTCMIRCLKEIHGKKVYHMDIAWRNFLYRKIGTKYVVKLCDFGCSKVSYRDSTMAYRIGNRFDVPAKETHKGSKRDTYQLCRCLLRLIVGIDTQSEFASKLDIFLKDGKSKKPKDKKEVEKYVLEEAEQACYYSEKLLKLLIRGSNCYLIKPPSLVEVERAFFEERKRLKEEGWDAKIRQVKVKKKDSKEEKYIEDDIPTNETEFSDDD